MARSQSEERRGLSPFRARSSSSRCPLGATPAPLRRGSIGHSPREVHMVPSEVLFRSERIMGAAPELEVVERRWSAERVGVAVMNFESEGLATLLATTVPVGAPLAIAGKHRAAHGRWDVPSTASRRSRWGGIRRDIRRGARSQLRPNVR
jgi:hypothetical protein